jgi:O-methyltransferase
MAELEAAASGLLSYADRRLQSVQAEYEDQLAQSKDEARRLAAINATLEARLDLEAARNDELHRLFHTQPARPAAPRPSGAKKTAGRAEAGGPGTTRYLELLKGCLTRMVFLNDIPGGDLVELARQREIRMVGGDWPEDGETMVGMLRLDCVQHCVETALADQVPGDMLEAGVWRGGTTILMKGILEAHGEKDRRIWVADSFEGLPPPDEVNFPQDVSIDLSGTPELAVSLEQVQANFARYDLLDDNVRFLKGWFKDTLATAPVHTLAVLRLDGDYYESTIQILEALYHKVSPGGFVIVDDYGTLEQCRRAVTDFREANGIDDEIVTVDWTGVYWRRSGH